MTTNYPPGGISKTLIQSRLLASISCLQLQTVALDLFIAISYMMQDLVLPDDVIEMLPGTQ